MLSDEQEKVHRLDDVEQRLYSKNPDAIRARRPAKLHDVSHAVSNAWTDEKTDKVIAVVKNAGMQSSFFKKFFIVAVAFFVIACAIGGFLFFTGSSSVSSDNIAITVLGNAYTPGGENLPLTIQIANSNSVSLELADLVVTYGRNNADLSNPADLTTIRQPIGTIEPGKVFNQKIDLTLYGTQGVAKQVEFSLEYHVAGSNAIFQKDKIFPVIINTEPVSLTVNADTSVTANQPYTFIVDVAPNTKQTIPNMMLKIDYPTGFSFQNAEPSPTYLSNVWSLGDLTPGATKEIRIVGMINAQDGDERSFRVYAGSVSPSDKNTIGTTFASTLHTVDIVKPFLEAHLAVNGDDSPTVVVKPKSAINGRVTWVNNLPLQILNAKIIVKLTGALIDPTTVESEGGFYNSADNTITWDRNTLPDLASVSPGATGTLSFDFRTSSLYQNGQLADSPQVGIDVSISGQEPQQGVGTQEINSVEHKTVKLSTDFQVTGATSYSGLPFANTGPLPPVVNQKTTYTVQWAVATSGNDVSNVVVKATLPPYVHFYNAVSPTNASLSIDPVSGALVWNAGTVHKGSGFTTTPASILFQIEFNPSVSQLGTTPDLITNIVATGTDAYTGGTLSSTWKSVTTRLLNDPIFQPGDEKVTAQ